MKVSAFFKKMVGLKPITLRSGNISLKIMNSDSIKEIEELLSKHGYISASEVESFLGREPKSNIHAAEMMKIVNDNKNTQARYTK